MSSHPGPKSAYTRLVVPTRALPVRLHLGPGDALLPALVRELAALGHDSAFLRISGAPVTELAYVGPDWPDPEGRRIAWYSTPRSIEGPGEILDLRLFTGLRDGKLSLHGHGFWRCADGREHFGHILPDACVLAGPCEVTGYALPEARFEAALCGESEFFLFLPVARAPCPGPDAALVKLAPSASLPGEVTAACRDLGFNRARVEGIGSLITADFADGTHLESRASEFLITSGNVARDSSEGGCDLEIEITGIERRRRKGRLSQEGNRVLVSSELLILLDDK